IDFQTLFGPKPGSSRPGLTLTPEQVRVVGNLPYYITSDILLRLFEFREYFSRLVIMVQREVADRIAAAPGGRDYGLLSATAHLRSEEHTSELQSRGHLVCRLLLEKKKKKKTETLYTIETILITRLCPALLG